MIPVAPVPDVVRRSKGTVVRCWRQVAGRSVKELLPYIWMGFGVGASRRVRSIKICSGAGVATYW